MLTRKQAIKWAEHWITSWNDGDLERVLSLYREDVRFESPLAEAATGSPLVEGKAALRRYWSSAPYGIRSVRLQLERAIWDPVERELAIVYVAQLTETRLRGCELITLDIGARAVRGLACFGSVLDPGPMTAAGEFITHDIVDMEGGL
jgi:hypothetical protein